MQQENLFSNETERQIQESGAVTCLGKTFVNEQARRDYFLVLLAEKLKDPEFRKIDGFPVGSDEDILNLSDPPYYTACPNPWIANFISDINALKSTSINDYHREPFTADVSEGKSDPIYNAHTYHTKVPPKAIARYILHYTNPGDIVLDGFSGTGMTGIASQLCGDKSFIEELGYKVDKDGCILQKNSQDNWAEFSKVGCRFPVLNDLSPIATFITNTYGKLFDIEKFYMEALDVISKIEKEVGWIYEVGSDKVLNGIWSDVFHCPICTAEIVYWNAAVANDQISKSFACPTCGGIVGKASSKSDGAIKLDRAFETKFDKYIGSVVKKPKLILVEQTVKNGKKSARLETSFKEQDELLDKIDSLPIISSVPLLKFEEGRQTNKLINGSGIDYVHWMYTPRALYVYGTLWDVTLSSKEYTSFFKFCLTGINNYVSRKQGYFGGGGGVAGTLFTPSIHLERNIFDVLRRKLKGIANINRKPSDRGCISTQNTGSLKNIPTETVDYIFIDPPFGENFQYAELNSFAEAWLKVKTDTSKDCVMNYVHKKDLSFYMNSMKSSFHEFFRVLKSGHWMTVEFSNTQASVWNAIQSGLQEAGFVVANVAALDKQQGSFNAVTNTTSVKQDLVISAYKPNDSFEMRFKQEAHTEEGVWDFIRTHLSFLPVIKFQGRYLHSVPERDHRILFDQLVAYYVRKGFRLPIDSKEFQLGLSERFLERDGMYFLPEQVAEYDKNKLISNTLMQTSLFVKDEASAIDWLRQLLKEKPQNLSEITPLYLQQLNGFSKNEVIPDLRELLNLNFLCYDGHSDVPEQIHAYLSSNWKELRNLPKDAPTLIAKAKERWYLPDPNKANDLRKLREKSLLKEFEEYKKTKNKLKVFRIEAVRAGFRKLWEEQDLDKIITIANKLPSNALEEDPVLLMYYDQAITLSQVNADDEW